MRTSLPTPQLWMTLNFMVPSVPRENYVIPPDTDPYAGACNANARENHHPCVAEVQREDISREVVSCFPHILSRNCISIDHKRNSAESNKLKRRLLEESSHLNSTLTSWMRKRSTLASRQA